MQDWQNCRVLVTGHTGFKGAWLSHWLLKRNADVAGLALAPDTQPNLFDSLELASGIDSMICDIRDRKAVKVAIDNVQPDIVFHMAAQPLVRQSYSEPVETFDSNVMGTAHVLDALREQNRTMGVVVVTTDKVYENFEREKPYDETDHLGGHDPYSASKAAAELVTSAYRSSYFSGSPCRVASARAGNVIGGGDWAADRIVPDLARAFSRGEPLELRNPGAVRPWQHVLDSLFGYIKLAQGLYAGNVDLESAFNFGPPPSDEKTVETVVELAQQTWAGDVRFTSQTPDLHEAGRLVLSSDKAKDVLGWRPTWNFETAISRTVAWYKSYYEGGAPGDLVDQDIAAFEAQASCG